MYHFRSIWKAKFWILHTIAHKNSSHCRFSSFFGHSHESNLWQYHLNGACCQNLANAWSKEPTPWGNHKWIEFAAKRVLVFCHKAPPPFSEHFNYDMKLVLHNSSTPDWSMDTSVSNQMNLCITWLTKVLKKKRSVCEILTKWTFAHIKASQSRRVPKAFLLLEEVLIVSLRQKLESFSIHY